MTTRLGARAVAICAVSVLLATPAMGQTWGDAGGPEVSVTDYGTVDLAVQDTDLAQVLEMLSIQGRKNIITSRNVSATVSANLYDVTFYEALDAILTVNGYAYSRANYKFSWRMLRLIPRIIYWYATALPRMMKNLVPIWRDEKLPAYLATIDQWKTLDLASASDKRLFTGIRELTSADATYWFAVSIVMGVAKMTDGLLHFFLTSKAVKGDLTSGMFLRGFPSKTMEAQELLEAIARRIQKVESLRDFVLATPAGDLPEALKQEPGGHSISEDILQYLRMRAI